MGRDTGRQSGLNLHVTVSVPLEVLLFGGKVEVPTVDGPVRTSVDGDAVRARRIRLPGRGYAGRGGERGDTVGRLEVRVDPGVLSTLQTALGRPAEGHASASTDEATRLLRDRLRRYHHRLLLRQRSRAVRTLQRKAERKWRRAERLLARRRLLRMARKRVRRAEREGRDYLRRLRARERVLRRRERSLGEQDAAVEARRQWLASREEGVEAREAALRDAGATSPRRPDP